MTKLQRPSGTKRKRCDWTSGINLRFVIGMPPHAVLTVSVEVEQASVEARSAGFVHLLPQQLEPAGPALTAVGRAAVSVTQSFAGQEPRQARHGVSAAVHLDHRLLPCHLLRDGALPNVAPLRRQPASVQRPGLPARAHRRCHVRTVHDIHPGCRWRQPE